MTLVELLIVITVMTILIGIALPVMKTSLESSRLREASRMLNTQFSVARAIALETGRPAGVWLAVEALPGTSPAVVYATRAFLAETPPPYSGDFVGATATVNAGSSQTGIYDYYTATFAPAMSSGLVGTSPLVNAYDEIRFGYKGPSYTITQITPGATYTMTFRGEHGRDPAPPATTVPYQILRRPERSSASPLELPKGVVVDLMRSGYGLTGTDFSAATGYLCIVFSATGEVSKVLGAANQYPTQTIHLLLGSIEKLPDSAAATDKNLEDNSNLWVSIAPQTGRVTTVENAWTAGGTIADARQFAQSSQAKGGR
jgi:type II secretory pathway pseudopilin PulG